MTITVEIRNQYGTDRIYPADDTARTFARIAGTHTLTEFTIKQIKQLGYTIVVKQKELAL